MDNNKNKRNTTKSLYEGKELVVNAFKSGLFPLRSPTGTRLKISTPKQMVQRLPIALAIQDKNGTNQINTIIKVDAIFMNTLLNRMF